MTKSRIAEHLALMGLKARDRVSLIEGIVESIGFDLYGCVQALLRPQGEDMKEGGERRGQWFDVKRLEIIDHTPVMPLPDFCVPEIGPAAKPDMRR